MGLIMTIMLGRATTGGSGDQMFILLAMTDMGDSTMRLASAGSKAAARGEAFMGVEELGGAVLAAVEAVLAAVEGAVVAVAVATADDAQSATRL
jgi:hypothetical protein